MGVAPVISFYVIPDADAVATSDKKLNQIDSTPAGAGLSSGYDNFGSVAIGSNFTVYRQVWNNRGGATDVSSATDLRLTLHRSMTGAEASAASGGSNTTGEVDGASPGPANVIVDEGINPPSTSPDQNQWVIGGTGPGGSAASNASELWTRATVIRDGGNLTTDTGGKIGYIVNTAIPSYQFHTVPSTIEIEGAAATSNTTNYITLQLDTTIPNAYTGTGILYSRLHLEYKFV